MHHHILQILRKEGELSTRRGRRRSTSGDEKRRNGRTDVLGMEVRRLLSPSWMATVNGG